MEQIGKEVLMDHHLMNLKDTGLRFLSLRSRLLKCTTCMMEKLEGSLKANSYGEVLHRRILPR
jgi:hypothetical protein